MKELIFGTTAYSTFKNDVGHNRCSHAYMLHLNDQKNLLSVLKIFALKFFGFEEGSAEAARLEKGNFPDCRFFPPEGKPLNADAVGEVLADSVLNPLEGDKKLFVISNFEQASALLQNKLLKTLEEPPRGVYFLLGVTSLAPILDTVKSRVKTLAIPPFTPEQIFKALERKGENSLNRAAAESCGGIFGVAENMIEGGWFKEITDAALEICTVHSIGDIAGVAAKYGDTKYKSELLSEISLLLHNALEEKVKNKAQGEVARAFQTPVLIGACERVDKASADLKFNAYFQGLLFNFMLNNIEENNKWSKLQA